MGTDYFKAKKSAVIMLLAIVFLSACVSRQVRADANNGLVISRFFADPERIDSGDIFRVYMEVENVGQRTADKARLELISSAFEGQDISPGAGVIKPGEPLPEFRAERTERNYYFETLAPPKADYNQPGDFRVVSWPLQAPFVPEGTAKEFRLLGRLTYSYSTSAVATIPVYTKNEMRNTGLPKSFDAAGTSGPLKIEVSGPKNIVVNTDPDAISISRSEFAVYTVTMRNTGDGIPITSGINGLVTGTMRFAGGITPVDCLKEKTEAFPASQVSLPSQQTFKILQQQGYDPEAYQIDLPDGENGLILRNGEAVTFSCTLALARGQWVSRPFGTATISFDIDYTYFIEKEATVTVRGASL